MASKAAAKSVEPNIADLVNGWLKSYKVDYKLEQEPLNTEIDQALSILTEKEYYEGHIDPDNGNDWNQTAPIDTKPTLEDFKKSIGDYLAWEVSSILKNQPMEDDRVGK